MVDLTKEDWQRMPSCGSWRISNRDTSMMASSTRDIPTSAGQPLACAFRPNRFLGQVGLFQFAPRLSQNWEWGCHARRR